MFLTHPSLLSLALVFSTGFVFSTGLSYFSSVSRPSIHLIHHWYLIAGACNGHPVLSTSRLVSCVLFCIILTFIFSCAFVSPYLVPFSDKKKEISSFWQSPILVQAWFVYTNLLLMPLEVCGFSLGVTEWSS